MLFKLIFAIVTGAFAVWTWRRANQWQDAEEIPASQDEFGRISKSDDSGFRRYIIWTKFTAGICGAFFVLSASSLSVDVIRFLQTRV